MSENSQTNRGGLDFVNNPSYSWDRLAEQLSPLEVDAIWTAKQRQLLGRDTCEGAIKTRFYLKAIYAMFVKNYNFGVFRYRFMAFELPPTHFEDWKSMSDVERVEIFDKMRFVPVGDDTQNENRFVLMFDEKMHLLFGHLDSVFVARHGIQVPEKHLVVRQATPDEGLRYARYRLAHDERIYTETKKSFAESQKHMKAQERDEAREILKQLEVLVKQGETIKKNITASIEAVDKEKSQASASSTTTEPPTQKKSTVDPTTGLTKETLDDLDEFRAHALQMTVENEARALAAAVSAPKKE